MVKSLLAIVVCFILFSSCATRKGTVLSGPQTKSSPQPKRTGGISLSGQDYINRYKDIAIREMNQYGIPASIKLAQALLESGNGNSYLARNANNHFGIKCAGDWKGQRVIQSDDNPNDCFRVYKDPEDSFEDHSRFLLRKRYEKLFTLDKNDYKGWARGLKQAGYATNPRYPELLIDLIERYELYRYDRTESFREKEKREDKIETIIETKVDLATVDNTAQIKTPVKMTIYEVKASDTLYAISRKYNVTVEQIMELNGLTADSLAIGQLLVITK
ncbi:LysM peptidoglycan-binding domain-containing protein [Sphingobacterium sp. SGG-5]|uniref:glucosaminidase domain-containing protein n=1 Tax=Sphingobacterium sp. SGG-5 TaxID=2710881 RepID=UPI0013ED940D|nr:glucosaminidase domain-containing protein [Sphingobacterium sp. SGG-5]NGM60979.1 LysM peptidoglycan-binding domain-containing protein [Sphingobacterium sp. SGG-5]